MAETKQRIPETVAEMMCSEVVTAEPTTTLYQAIGLMVRNGIRHLPAVEEGKVVAVISDRNVRMMISEGQDPEERRRYLSTTMVMAHASHPVTTIGPGEPPQDAARIFVESRIGCLPVVDDADKLIGIVTQTDLLKWIAAMVD